MDLGRPIIMFSEFGCLQGHSLNTLILAIRWSNAIMEAPPLRIFPFTRHWWGFPGQPRWITSNGTLSVMFQGLKLGCSCLVLKMRRWREMLGDGSRCGCWVSGILPSKKRFYLIQPLIQCKRCWFNHRNLEKECGLTIYAGDSITTIRLLFFLVSLGHW